MSANEEVGESARSNETGDRFVRDQYQAGPGPDTNLSWPPGLAGWLAGTKDGRGSQGNVVFYIFIFLTEC